MEIILLIILLNSKVGHKLSQFGNKVKLTLINLRLVLGKEGIENSVEKARQRRGRVKSQDTWEPFILCETSKTFRLTW